MQMARATAEGVQAARPQQRTFVITRSGWAGLQRYAMNWMGDNISSWECLRLTAPMIANLGLSGLAFTGPDTGGFAGDCTPELLTRWLQLGVFTPFLRNHASLGAADQEPWVHGEPYESINRRAIELRYHLLPYIYTAFWQCAQTGAPMLRPLFWHWQDDALTHTSGDEFMFGDALLIAPVGEAGVTERDVYLPRGDWYDWWTGQRYAGGQSVAVAAPLQRIPIFARAGSVVPGWPVMQYTNERALDVLTLHVFPGDGASVLYEDDGQSLAYQQGVCRVTHFSTHTSADGLTIERRSEGSFTPDYAQVELVVHGVAPDALRGIRADGQAVTGWAYDAETQSVRCRAALADRYEIG
jgi:alpha-glucosidase